MIARAVWNGVVLAETSRPVLLEGNVYFPSADVHGESLTRTRAWTVCPWKGVARYYTVNAGGQVNKNVPGATRIPARSPARSRIMWRSGMGSGWSTVLASGGERRRPRHRPASLGQ